VFKNVVACLWQTGPIYWAIVPDDPRQLQKSGGERLPKYPKLNGKSKLNSLII